MECGFGCACEHREEGLSRRDVLGAMAVAAVAVPLLANSASAESSDGGIWVKTVRPAELAESTAHLVKGSDNKSLAVLVKEGKTVTALSSRCTHKSCAVSAPNPHGPLRCPCHGAEFDLQGKNLRGPGRNGHPKPDLAPLGRFALRLDAQGVIEVNVGSPIAAGAKDASLTVS